MAHHVFRPVDNQVAVRNGLVFHDGGALFGYDRVPANKIIMVLALSVFIFWSKMTRDVLKRVKNQFFRF